MGKDDRQHSKHSLLVEPKKGEKKGAGICADTRTAT